MSQTLIARPSDIAYGGKQSKVDRYGWIIRDAPGEFAMIPKHQFAVDMTYQRRIKEARVLKIAREWSWIACGTIKVVLRPSDAEYMVIDGQHRVDAARRRSDIDRLPTLIFEVDNISDEAQGFLNANTLRKPPSIVERFNAMITSKHPGALIAQELLSGEGRSIKDATNSNGVTCMAAILKCLEVNERSFRAVWPVIVKLCEGRTIHQRLVYGLFYVETHLPPGISLSQPQWSKRLQSVGHEKLMDAIVKAAAFLGSLTPKTSAEGIVNAMNAGLRNRLPFSPGTDLITARGTHNILGAAKK